MLTLPLRISSVVPAAVQQTATIIFLHGLGDSGQGWSEILPQLSPPHAKIVCPNAPIQKVTINDGMAIPAWFDLRHADQPRDDAGLISAAAAIHEVIQTEVEAGIPSKRIVLGGFSQGGAVALQAGLTSPYKLAGVLALSTWLPFGESFAWEKIQKQRILQCHGDEDHMVSMKAAQRTADALKKYLQDDAMFKLYAGLGHDITSEDEQKDIIRFLKTSLPAVDSKL